MKDEIMKEVEKLLKEYAQTMKDEIKREVAEASRNHTQTIKGEVRKEVGEILLILAGQMKNKSYLGGSSLLSLKEPGKKLSKKMDAPAIARQYKDELVRIAKDKKLNPYQIQEDCFTYAATKILKNVKQDKESFDKLAAVAYDEGTDLSVLMQIVAVVLRDQVLAEVGSSSGGVRETNQDYKKSDAAPFEPSSQTETPKLSD